MKKDNFYQSQEWRWLRHKALTLYGKKCHCCGGFDKPSKPLHVDHIKPRSRFPNLSLVITNLQILCEDCNTNKSNISYTDYRPDEHIYVAEQWLQYPSKFAKLVVERKHGVVSPHDKIIRLQQSKSDKNQNLNIKQRLPKQTKSQRKKEQATMRKIQISFLREVRVAQKNDNISNVLRQYENDYGEEVLNTLVKLCNIQHWIS